jgi:two-component system sensor histidine kinase YesM
MKVLGFIRNLYGNSHFRTKIILNFLVINLIITVSVGIIYYYKSASIIEDELTKSVDYSISRLKLDISSFTDRIMDISDSIATNSSIRKVLIGSANKSSFEAQLGNYMLISDIYNSFPYNPAIYRSRIYMENSFNSNRQTISFLNLREAPAENWYNRTNQLNGKMCWTNSYDFKAGDSRYEKLISCARVLKDYNQTDRIISYVSIDVRERDLYGILNETEKAIDGKIYLTGSDDEIVSCYDGNIIGKRIDALNGFDIGGLAEKNRSVMEINGEKSLVVTDALPELGWRIVAIISMQGFVDKNNAIFISLLQISLAVFLLSLVLAALLSFNITGRIRKLIEYIRKMDVEKYEQPLEAVYRDEISELIKAFNHMVYENHILVNEVYKKNLEKKGAEIKLLQAQINPHFLYNALDTANWMAQKYKARDIMKFLKHLSNFYRLSLSKGRNIVSINDEIEHVKSYLKIQQIKSNDAITARYDISPDILGYFIPKLILQPIVENAIIHGIQETEEQKGTIGIEGFAENALIKLRVRDDGAGMSPEKLELIRAKIAEDSDSSGSYGLRNVNQRIGHYFGKDHGINISSVEGSGTVVEVFFPQIMIDGYD